MTLGNPLSKLACVGDGGGEECKAHGLWHQHNALLPHHAPLLVPDIVDLVVHYQARLPCHSLLSASLFG